MHVGHFALQALQLPSQAKREETMQPRTPLGRGSTVLPCPLSCSHRRRRNEVALLSVARCKGRGSLPESVPVDKNTPADLASFRRCRWNSGRSLLSFSWQPVINDRLVS